MVVAAKSSPKALNAKANLNKNTLQCPQSQAQIYKGKVMEIIKESFFEVIKNFKKPIVAQVNGPCVGEAFTMLLYCDLVYASDKALFSIPSVALGRTTRFGAALMMATSAGIVRAAEKLMLSEPISANEALDMRLITGIADEDSLDQLVASKVARLAVLPPQAVQATKTLLTLSRNQLLNKLTDDEEAIWHRQNLSEEAKEALAAFLEGRKPSFRSE